MKILEEILKELPVEIYSLNNGFIKIYVKNYDFTIYDESLTKACKIVKEWIKAKKEFKIA